MLIPPALGPWMLPEMSLRTVVIILFSFCYLFIFNPYSAPIPVLFSSICGGLQKVVLCSKEFF